MIFAHIENLVSLFAKKGGKYCVASPGSRNAAISIYFSRKKGIETFSITDERSAGFFALGIAKKTESLVAVTCTSGTAALNLAPAVAEAFYQSIPLLVLTADRPPEWVDQGDGQTIRQNNLYGAHAKASYTLPTNPDSEEELWHCNRIINEAINCANQEPKGPVHINIPFREPFYPIGNEKIVFKTPRVIEEVNLKQKLSLIHWNELGKIINRSKKVLIVAGMGDKSTDFQSILNKVPFPIIADITSNLHQAKNSILLYDTILQQPKKQLVPDVVISFGGPIVSKKLKTFLRSSKIKEHWHIQAQGNVADVFKSLTKIVRTSPFCFFEELNDIDFSFHDENYLKEWQKEEVSAQEKLNKLFHNSDFNEFFAVKTIFDNLYSKSALHLANSMAVRYAGFIGTKKELDIFSNRGTSGIDGSSSTAMGYAYFDRRLNVLLTGDVAFFYDRNAYWNQYIGRNVRIIILNNRGGGIFKLIDGPKDQPEVDKLFVTKQNSTAEHAAKEFGFEYFKASNKMELDNKLTDFFDSSKKPKILEIFTNIEANTNFFDLFKKLKNG